HLPRDEDVGALEADDASHQRTVGIAYAEASHRREVVHRRAAEAVGIEREPRLLRLARFRTELRMATPLADDHSLRVRREDAVQEKSSDQNGTDDRIRRIHG